MQFTPTLFTPTLHRGSRLPLALGLMASAFLSNPAGAQSAHPPLDALHSTRPALPANPRRSPSADWTNMPGRVQAAANSHSDVMLFDQTLDGALWARGNSYKARFDGAGATIVPFFGSDAPHNYPLQLRAHGAGLGEPALDAAPRGRVTRKGDTVRIEHGEFVEEYDLTTEALEQRFVFDGVDRASDLVLHLDVASELAGSDLGDSLRFENERGRIDYGVAFAVDADGARIAIDSRLVDGAIELRVPASFVARAALPLVIDPLITAYTASSSVRDDFYPDVSFDVGTDRWCIVFANAWSQTDHDAYARLATGSYQLLPGLVTLDLSSDAWTTPRVADNYASKQFLACFAVVPPSGVAEIHGRCIDSASATAGAPFQISPADGIYRNGPDVGGDPYNGTPSYFCVVWQRSVGATDVDIDARLVSSTGSFLSSVIPLDASSEWHELPAISNSDGPFASGHSAWTVVWQRHNSDHDHDIYGAQIEWNGSILNAKFPIETSTWDDINPAVSTVLDSTTPGVPPTYVVAYERDFTDQDVMATTMQGTSVLQTINVSADRPSPEFFSEQVAPSVDSDGAQFLIGFAERTTPTAYNANMLVGSYFWDGVRLAACQVPEVIAGTVQSETDLHIHSKASSGGPSRDYLTAWVYDSANQGLDVVAGYYRGCGYMVESVCEGDGSGPQCPCGNDGTFGHGCANSSSSQGALLSLAGDASVSADSVVLSASQMPSHAFCLFFQGTSLSAGTPFGNGLRCVNGSIIRMPLKQGDTGGNTSYPQAGDAAVSVLGHVSALGDTRYYQAWYRDPASLCTKTFNLTNALRVIWTP